MAFSRNDGKGKALLGTSSQGTDGAVPSRLTSA